MILIFSIETDFETLNVSKWLNFLNKDFVIINQNNKINYISLSIGGDIKIGFENKNEIISFSDITTVWYRRGNFSNENIENTGDKFRSNFFELIERDNAVLMEFLHSKLNEKFNLNNYNKKSVNKLIVLDYAKKVGLVIPKSKVTNQKSELLSFLSSNASSITKDMSRGVAFDQDELLFMTYTTRVDEKAIENNPEFGISFFQEETEKLFEIRSFFLIDQFYSMAIFSQKDKTTEVDFRHYNDEKPNRTVPFKLPIHIEKKLLLIAKEFNLNSGSFDLMYSKSKAFVFLEVNPVGMFNMTSIPCNYNLDKKIATLL